MIPVPVGHAQMVYGYLQRAPFNLGSKTFSSATARKVTVMINRVKRKTGGRPNYRDGEGRALYSQGSSQYGAKEYSQG